MEEISLLLLFVGNELKVIANRDNVPELVAKVFSADFWLSQESFWENLFKESELSIRSVKLNLQFVFDCEDDAKRLEWNRSWVNRWNDKDIKVFVSLYMDCQNFALLPTPSDKKLNVANGGIPLYVLNIAQASAHTAKKKSVKKGLTADFFNSLRDKMKTGLDPVTTKAKKVIKKSSKGAKK